MSEDDYDDEVELLDIELERSRSDVAASLRAIADELEAGDSLTIAVGDENVTVEPPGETLEYEVELEREPTDEGDEIELELELEWIVDRSDAETADDGSDESEDGDDAPGVHGEDADNISVE